MTYNRATKICYHISRYSVKRGGHRDSKDSYRQKMEHVRVVYASAINQIAIHGLATLAVLKELTQVKNPHREDDGPNFVSSGRWFGLWLRA